jgi:hypothetical protein
MYLLIPPPLIVSVPHCLVLPESFFNSALTVMVAFPLPEEGVTLI